MSGKTKPEDATEAMLDKMSKDSFPASDPPQMKGTTAAEEAARDQHRSTISNAPGAVAELELGEEIEGGERAVTLVFEGRDAAILQIVADGRRLQVALPCNPLEVCAEDLDALIAALRRARARVRHDPG